MRKVVSICNVFNKSTSEPILLGNSHKPKHLDAHKASNAKFVNHLGINNSWNEKADLTFIISSKRENLRLALKSNTEFSNDNVSRQKNRRHVISKGDVYGILVKEEKIEATRMPQLCVVIQK